MAFGKRQANGFCGVERRRAARRQVDRPAHIMFADSRMIGCYVRDVSSTGALLELASTFGLSDAFVLRFAGKHQWVEVAWSGKWRAGVQFV